MRRAVVELDGLVGRRHERDAQRLGRVQDARLEQADAVEACPPTWCATITCAGCVRSLLSASTVERAVSTCRPRPPSSSASSPSASTEDAPPARGTAGSRSATISVANPLQWLDSANRLRTARRLVSQDATKSRATSPVSRPARSRRSSASTAGASRRPRSCRPSSRRSSRRRRAELHRQVGVLIDRRGAIEHVIVGDASKIMLPDVGRMRGGRAGSAACASSTPTCAASRSPATTSPTSRCSGSTWSPRSRSTRRAGPGKLFVGHLLADGTPERPWRELPAEPATSTEHRLRRADRARSRPSSAARAASPRPIAARTARSSCTSSSAARSDAEARVAELRELCRTAGVKVARRARAAPARGRSEVPRRPRQARRDPAARDAARRRGRDLRPRPHARARRARSAMRPSSRSSIARC